MEVAGLVARWCVLAFIGLFSIFSFRLIYLQMIKHDEYAGLAAEKHVYKQVIHAERGSILDANNEVLAHNIPVETVVADATHLNNREATVDLLNAELEIPSDELAGKIKQRSPLHRPQARGAASAAQTRCVKNFARQICAAFTSSTTPRASIPTARCFAT